MSQLLRVDKLTKRFGQLVAVNGLSFTVERGEVFGIAGPNGSGKSTLFNALTRIPFGADSGRVLLDGTEITRLRPHLICRRGLVRTFQKESTFDGLSVFQNVLIGATYGREGAADGEEGTLEALSEVGLLKKRDQPAGALSVYEKKLLMFASAVAARPKLLLLDEPASGLTTPEIDHFVTLIRRLNDGGVTVVVIEHVLPLLLSVSQRLLVLNHGEALVVGAPDTVIQDERVIEAYLGRRSQTERPPSSGVARA